MGVLSAGIRSLLRKTEGADLSRPAEAPDPGARSSRNGGRHHLGTVGEIIPESVGGIIPERRAASPGIGTHACGGTKVGPFGRHRHGILVWTPGRRFSS